MLRMAGVGGGGRLLPFLFGRAKLEQLWVSASASLYIYIRIFLTNRCTSDIPLRISCQENVKKKREKFFYFFVNICEYENKSGCCIEFLFFYGSKRAGNFCCF